MKIALAGNPNSGKTTLFNAMTGKSESVGNWPGVTVDKKEANLKKRYQNNADSVRIIDLPGAYSLSPFTGEEVVTRDIILGEGIDVIINIVDGANISRSLFLTTQLIELGIPVVIALNKSDIIEKRAEQINIAALEQELGCPIISIIATEEKGLQRLLTAALNRGKQKSQPSSLPFASSDDLARQNYINELIAGSMSPQDYGLKTSLSDKIDHIVTNKWLGLPIFFMVLWAIYSLSIEGPGGYLSEYVNEELFGSIVPEVATNLFNSIGVHTLLRDLLVEGVIAGVGAVLGFLPLIMVLFFLLALLEDSGYMARVALVMDRHLKKIGLSGKSIIPMIVGSGCSVPGVMATKTISGDSERRMTTILTPFVPCGAKLPIIALFSAVFFPGSSWVGPSMYMIAFAVIALGGLLLKKLFVWETQSSFIIELPEYKVPSLKTAIMKMFAQAKGFIYKAATIIMIMNTLVWFMQAYDWSLSPAISQEASILGSLGGIIAPLLVPLGFSSWELAAASVTGFVAKENVVGTLAIILGASEQSLYMADGPLTALLNPVTAYAFLVFNLFTPPCFAAIGAMNSELESRTWLGRALAFQIGVGYTLAMVIAQVGSLLLYGQPAIGLVPAIILTVAIFLVISYQIKRTARQRQSLKSHIALGGI